MKHVTLFHEQSKIELKESDMFHSIDFLGKNSMGKALGAIRGDHMVTIINMVAVALFVKGLNISLTNSTLGIKWSSIDSLEGCLNWVFSSNKRKYWLEALWKADVSEDNIFPW